MQSNRLSLRAWNVAVVAAVALGISAFACGGSSDSTASGPEQDITEKICGGIAAIKCPDGYDCALSGNNPDASGKCQKAAVCGGIAGLKCPAGSSCVYTTKFPDATGYCAKGKCLLATCSDEENCDNTGGMWLDDDPNPQGLFCNCPDGTVWTAGKGCEKVPTCATLTCSAGYHCCSGPAMLHKTSPATCQKDGQLCPL
jgi:hypothetical protein